MSVTALRREAISLVSALPERDLRLVVRIMKKTVITNEAIDSETLSRRLHAKLSLLQDDDYVNYNDLGRALTRDDYHQMLEHVQGQLSRGQYVTAEQHMQELEEIVDEISSNSH